ncbi:MAG: hypothetical protein GX431_03190 [Bacteroidales bacterium]|jgi:hypothetical protein|nr:hypothetical protein [Bacteroidales bacterium]
MKNKRNTGAKTTKFVRVDNSTWIETDIWVPDEVARIQFLQKVQLTKPGTFSGQPGNGNFVVKS